MHVQCRARKKIEGDLNEKRRDEKGDACRGKGGEMKGERRDDKEAERKGDVPLGGSHR